LNCVSEKFYRFSQISSNDTPSDDDFILDRQFVQDLQKLSFEKISSLS